MLLAYFFFKQSEYDRAEEYVKKTLALSEKIRDTETQSQSLQMMAFIRVEERKYQEAISYFLSVIEKCEKMRSSLRDNDKFKISFSDPKIHAYRDLSVLLCVTGNPIKALYVSELSRARALADLLSAKFSVENQILADPRTWTGLKSFVAKDCSRTCLYVSYHSLWTLKAGEATHFEEINGNDVAKD